MPIRTRPGKEARKRATEEKKKARGEASPIAGAEEQVLVPCSSLRYKKKASDGGRRVRRFHRRPPCAFWFCVSCGWSYGRHLSLSPSFLTFFSVLCAKATKASNAAPTGLRVSEYSFGTTRRPTCYMIGERRENPYRIALRCDDRQVSHVSYKTGGRSSRPLESTPDSSFSKV
ncbi:hypothetical protein GW17_00034435 [Ensete ventricosum]|nr:hypothetical protein GW17_00034435 [Ensete ventricosum]